MSSLLKDFSNRNSTAILQTTIYIGSKIRFLPKPEILLVNNGTVKISTGTNVTYKSSARYEKTKYKNKTHEFIFCLYIFGKEE